MSNHENEIHFESYLNDVKETVETPSDDIRGRAISEGIGNLRSRIGKLDIQVNANFEKEVKEVRPHYEGTQLADVAIDVYRNNLQEEKPEEEIPKESCVTTKASRENTKAMVRSLTRDRNPSGAGDFGKYSHPATAGGSGNTGSPGPSNITIPPLSMEEYKEQIFKDFGLIEEEVEETYEAIHEEFVEEELDLVSELETNLLEMSDRSWIEVDRATRQLCLEHGVLVKDINKEFRSRHGMFPDKWIKEQVEIEYCGWAPLDEMVRLNKTGLVYDVTFMHRGSTQRFKFFWPSATRPTRDQMQKAIEGFYPKARLIAYYPSMNQDGMNHIVMVPPMTENYEVTPQDNWVEMTEEQQIVYDMICEEEGEPISFPFLEDDGSITLFVEDHDTGEEKEVIIEGSLHAWFGKSKSKDGKPGWVQSDGSPCANEKGETKTPKCYSSRRLAGLKKTKEGQKKIRSADARKSREDKGQQQKSGGAKPTNVRTFKDPKDYKKHPSGDYHKHEEVEYTTEAAKDVKGKGSGSKDACYHKVKSRFKVWPSAYASGALVKCRQKGADNWGNSKKNEEFIPEGKGMEGMTQKGGHKRSTESGAGLTQKGVEKYRRQNPGSKLQTAVTTPPSELKPGSKAANRRKSFCARSRGWTGERGKAARRRWNC